MFLLLFVLSLYSDVCHSQVVYSRMVPYDRRYVLNRPPVRRSAMEALERLRLPVARYFPQVDTQVASAPYQPPIAPLSAYQLTPDDIYALPPQWTDEFVQQLPERNDEEADYGNYEYEVAPNYRPAIYADEVYPQEQTIDPEVVDSNLYNDLMVNYILGDADPKEAMTQSDLFAMQRRSDGNPEQRSNEGVITLSSVMEANKSATGSTGRDATPVPPAPLPSRPSSPQVQVTAVPPAPEKKEVKSLVIPEPSMENQADADDTWRAAGQKEEPLFRPLQNSQRSTWDVLTRAKNSQKKRPIPLLKKMIQSGQQNQDSDPLMEELNNLKKEHDV